MVGRVGEVLCLETKACVLDQRLIRTPASLPVEKVPRVKLQAWFGRCDLEAAASRRIGEYCRSRERRARSQYPIMIVAAVSVAPFQISA